MHPSRSRLVVALVTYMAWILVTVQGAAMLQGNATSVTEMLNRGPGWQFLAAILLLVVVILASGWRDLGLAAPDDISSWRLLWLPGCFIIAFFAAATVFGLPPAGAMAWLLFNTMLVGISEELMFRGVLFQALRVNLRVWPAILLSSALFGGVHVLNGLLTGNFSLSAIQSVTAFMSGMLFAALVVRTGSLLPAIVLHWLWDFSILCLSGHGEASRELLSPAAMALPLLLVLPNILYAFYLLRNVRHEPAIV